MPAFPWQRNAIPFCLGFAAALLLYSFKQSVSQLDTLNGSPGGQLPPGWDLDHRPGGGGSSGSGGDDGSRKKVLALIGVQTGFTTDRSNPKYDYGARRQALRSTWFPATQDALDDLQRRTGIVLRFVIGHSPDAAAEAEIAAEEAACGGFLRLDMREDYRSLTNKTLTFLRLAAARYDAQFVVKADDDIFLRLDRIPAAVAQWSARRADYIGCMKTGQIYKTPNMRWFEPQHAVLGGESYFTHCWGTIYVLSGRAAAAVAAMPSGSMRFFANEDVTVGSWMLAFAMRHLDDRRLCETACTDTNVAVYDMPKCAGLCDAAKRLPELHAMPECNTPATQADGTLPMTPPAIDFPADD